MEFREEQRERSSGNALSDLPTAIVTGANGGIGREITAELLHRGFQVIMACRNPERASQVREQLIQEGRDTDLASRIRIEPLDLASCDSIQAFVSRLSTTGQPINLLINNAGATFKTFDTTTDGIERTFATNCLGPILLTERLLPLMVRTDDSVTAARIVNTISLTARYARFKGGFPDSSAHSYRRLQAYGRSKLALLIYTAQLAERTTGQNIVVNAADPGIVDTGIISMQCWYDSLADLIFRPLIRTPQKGAQAALHAASASHSGYIYSPAGARRIPNRIFHHPARETLASLWKSFL